MFARAHKTTLTVERLDERVVPVVNLTTAGLELPVGPAIVAQTDHLTDTDGTVNPFLRVDADGVERGYNTDARPVQFDERPNPDVTHSLTLGEVPLVTKGGVEYREFLLDVKQLNSSSRLSVDEVRVFLGNTGNLRMTQREVNRGGETLAGRNPVFELADRVILDAGLNRGQAGEGDMFLYVPASAFAGATDATFVYLFSHMGGRANARANGGAETWSVVDRPDEPPPPVDLGSLSGFVYVDANEDGMRVDENQVADAGLPDVTIELSKWDNTAQEYVILDVIMTLSDGSFSFGDLEAGTYAIREFQPDFGNYTTGTNSPGNPAGTVGDNADHFVGIVLGAGQAGTGYEFGEIEMLG